MQTVTLTHSQAQYLLSRLSDVATSEQEYRKEQRKLEGRAWAGADADTVLGAVYFDALNVIRENIRDSKKEEAKVNKLIQALRQVK